MSSSPSLLPLLLALLVSAQFGAAYYGVATESTTSTSIATTTSQAVTGCTTWGLQTQTTAERLSGTRVIYGNLLVVCSNASSLACLLTPQLTSVASQSATAAAKAYCDYLPSLKPFLKPKQALQKAGCSSLYAV